MLLSSLPFGACHQIQCFLTVLFFNASSSWQIVQNSFPLLADRYSPGNSFTLVASVIFLGSVGLLAPTLCFLLACAELPVAHVVAVGFSILRFLDSSDFVGHLRRSNRET